ncbi:hypothetical protein FGG78_19155 [Thioclava sp. BHET1]|nr:hypothetical protein FGG78_19155 [Thioclava sp. BHET1]
MKNVLIAAIVALVPATTAVAEVFVITDDQAGVSKVETMEAPALANVPEVNGNANKGFTYAQLWAGMDGFQVFEGRIAADGFVGSHDGPDAYVAYIVSGQGTMGNDGPDGKTDSTFTFGPGDVIVFGPGTMHHWSDITEDVVFVGFQRPD